MTCKTYSEMNVFNNEICIKPKDDNDAAFVLVSPSPRVHTTSSVVTCEVVRGCITCRQQWRRMNVVSWYEVHHQVFRQKCINPTCLTYDILVCSCILRTKENVRIRNLLKYFHVHCLLSAMHRESIITGDVYQFLTCQRSEVLVSHHVLCSGRRYRISIETFKGTNKLYYTWR